MLDSSAPPGLFIVYTSEEDPAASARPDDPMSLDELRASFRRVLGADVEMTEPRWLTRTVGNSRQADRYRAAPRLPGAAAAPDAQRPGTVATGHRRRDLPVAGGRHRTAGRKKPAASSGKLSARKRR
jgi:hypothetical protein